MDKELLQKLIKADFPSSKINPMTKSWIIYPTLSELIEGCKNKYPDYWFEMCDNPISGKFLARLAKYPSSNTQHLEDNIIYLEIGDSFEEAVAKLWLELQNGKEVKQPE